MASKEKDKGNRAEREQVSRLIREGIQAERMWGSDGRSRGHVKEVDVVILDRYLVQAKSRKNMAAYMRVPEGCDMTYLRIDGNGKKPPLRYYVVPEEIMITLLKLVAQNDRETNRRINREGSE